MIVNTIFNQTESYFSLRVLLKEMSFDSHAATDVKTLNDLLEKLSNSFNVPDRKKRERTQ